jgi:colicin import membrane protein
MDTLPISDIPGEIARRITTAADQLYEENGRASFPNVDAVRRRARGNMNDASGVMRAWRRAQSAAAAPLAVAIPSAVQEAAQALLTTVWNSAISSANVNLQTAQAGWELERAEAEACRHQLATAFDSQTEELSAAFADLRALEQKLSVHRTEVSAAIESRDALLQKVSAAESRAATAEARAQEIEKRADDLKTELSLAHKDAEQERRASKGRLDAAESRIEHLSDELMRKADTDAAAREELAQLRGQLKATVTEHQVLLAKPEPNGTRNVRTKPKPAMRTKPNDGA